MSGWMLKTQDRKWLPVVLETEEDALGYAVDNDLEVEILPVDRTFKYGEKTVQDGRKVLVLG